MSVLRGDCVEVMAGMDADSVDAIVCDPPYGLEFMGKDWDRLDASGRSLGAPASALSLRGSSRRPGARASDPEWALRKVAEQLREADP
jgi:DNA modification methylase